MLLYFIISNFIINIIFLGLIIYFIIALSKKNDNGSSQSEISLKSSNKNLVSSQTKRDESNVSNVSNVSNLNAKQKEDQKKGPKGPKGPKGLKGPKGPKEVKFVYDQKKCFECIRLNQQLGIFGDCPHCGPENYDTGCIPAIVQEGKPNNCVPKELTPEQAFWACKSVSSSSSMQTCNLIHPKHMLEYQKKECKRPDGDHDYYCAYDESDSCSYNVCRLDDYYSYGPESICDCQKVPHENLSKGHGRECIKGGNCNEFHPLPTAPELFNDPRLKRFYDGYGSWMDVPKLNILYSDLIADAQAIK